jgi:hypothetical protein
LEVKKLGIFKNELLLVEFELTSKRKITFKPEWLWLTQNDEIRPIHNLVLNSLDLKPNQKVFGLMQIRREDYLANQSARLEIRRDKTTFLTLPKVNSWNL